MLGFPYHIQIRCGTLQVQWGTIKLRRGGSRDWDRTLNGLILHPTFEPVCQIPPIIAHVVSVVSDFLLFQGPTCFRYITIYVILIPWTFSATFHKYMHFVQYFPVFADWWQPFWFSFEVFHRGPYDCSTLYCIQFSSHMVAWRAANRSSHLKLEIVDWSRR